MNCLDVRRRLGAEPNARDAPLEAHLAACPACARHAEELLRFERTLARALAVPVPPARAAAAAGVAAASPPRTRGRWLALAASLAGALVVATGVWTLYPREALAAALVGHMPHEPGSRVRTAARVPPESLAYVLARSGVRLAGDAPPVSYAMSCWFRGRHVPHLVVQTDDGPMTVMVLPHETVASPVQTDEGGYRVVIVPTARGAVAVLTEGPVAPDHIGAVIARFVASLRFAG